MSVIYYVDIVDGLDGNAGTDPDNAFLTIARAMTFCVAGDNDIIYILATGTTTVVNEAVVVAKAAVHIIGESQQVEIKPTATGSPSISITGDGVKLHTLTVGVTGAADNGITITSAKDVDIKDVRVENARTGIEIITSDDTTISNSVIQGSTAYGIDISAASEGTQIIADVVLFGNATGDVLDNGTGTYNGIIAHGSSPETIAAAVWDAVLTTHVDPTTFGGKIQKLLTKIQHLYFK